MIRQFKRFSFLFLFICFLASAAAQTTGNMVTSPGESESETSEIEQTTPDEQSAPDPLESDDTASPTDKNTPDTAEPHTTNSDAEFDSDENAVNAQKNGVRGQTPPLKNSVEQARIAHRFEGGVAAIADSSVTLGFRMER